MNGTKAVGIKGRVIRPFSDDDASHHVEITAKKAVVLAAGCLATPLILMRSNGAAGPSGQVGKNLQFHPGTAIMGLFPDPVEPWFGATQGYHSLHYLEEGFKTEVLWAPPAILATRFPGFGHEFKSALSRLKFMAPFDVIAAASKSSGYLRPRGSSWDPDIRYKMHPDDIEVFQRGIVVISELLWAAGATSQIPGLHGLPPEIHSRDDTQLIRDLDFHPSKATISCNHVFGTTRMGADPKTSVVDGDGRCHHTDNLYVSDTGIIPMSPAVNPMHTMMALADRLATRVDKTI